MISIAAFYFIFLSKKKTVERWKKKKRYAYNVYMVIICFSTEFMKDLKFFAFSNAFY